VTLAAPRQASREELLRFHDAKHVGWLEKRSRTGTGYLDYGDTPAFPGVLEAASAVAGSALEGRRFLQLRSGPRFDFCGHPRGRPIPLPRNGVCGRDRKRRGSRDQAQSFLWRRVLATENSLPPGSASPIT
jgi:hypothetical protein